MYMRPELFDIQFVPGFGSSGLAVVTSVWRWLDRQDSQEGARAHS
jgi:hypothetical protein